MGNVHPHAEITEFNDAHRVLTEDESRALDTPEKLTRALREAAQGILQGDYLTTKPMPMCGIDNPFVVALRSRVPTEIYRRENVWWLQDGDVHFHPWVYRVGFTTRAANDYATYYEGVNGKGTFPRDYFSAAIRRAKNCAYAVKSRAKRRAAPAAAPEPPAAAVAEGATSNQ